MEFVEDRVGLFLPESLSRFRIEFDDVAGLSAYLAHPKHAAIGSHFMQAAEAALAYDYEMEDWTAKKS